MSREKSVASVTKYHSRLKGSQSYSYSLSLSSIFVRNTKTTMEASNVDLDSQLASLLDSTDEFFVQQRIRWAEAVTQGCIEQSNIYDVFDKATNRKILVIQEQSGDLNRWCCAPGHSFFAKFYLANENTGEAVGDPIMTMEREGCDCFDPCPKPCLCCFACTPACSDGATLYSGDMGGLGMKPGELLGQRDRTYMIGEIIQPVNGGKFKPIVQVMERDGSPDPHSTTFAAFRGPCFFGGCSEFYCNVDFGMSKAKDGMDVEELHQLTFDYAQIRKIRPKSLTQALREAFSDSDLYAITFNEHVTTVQKANVLASMIMVDYMFFERDNDICSYAGNGDTQITLFNCFIYGCVCPCSFTLESDSIGAFC